MALSFSEKRTLQKTVATNLAALAAGNVSFTDKRRLQKEITDAMAKLNAKVEDQKYYHLQTRNWNQSAEAKALLDDTLQYGVIRYQNAAGDNDDKYVLDTTDKALADKVNDLFKAAQSLSGGDATYDVLGKPYGDMGGVGDDSKTISEMVDAVVSYGGQLGQKIPPTEVRFAIEGRPAKIVAVTTDQGVAGFIASLMDTQKSSSIMHNADQAVFWAVSEAKGTPAGNQNLLDLQSGKFDSLDPLAFLGKLKEIADEINDIEPLKGPAIAYIEKNSERVSAVMESALQETFGKLWGATA